MISGFRCLMELYLLSVFNGTLPPFCCQAWSIVATGWHGSLIDFIGVKTEKKKILQGLRILSPIVAWLSLNWFFHSALLFFFFFIVHY